MADKRPLPEGWRIDGLWTGIASGNPHYQAFPKGTQPTDAEVSNADRIVVTYISRKTGVTDYRTIPGAMSKRQVGAIIRYTTRRVSPPGRTSR
jgi:hypothetical protein